jgi:hypothetical protein
LASQLETIAKMMKANARFMHNEREVYMVRIGGFDTHRATGEVLSEKWTDIDSALEVFGKEMKAQGLWDNIVIVQASEFGRALKSNGDGSDHGWGGNYFIAGGAVRGGQVLGTFPNDLSEFGPQITHNGRLIPTTSWDQIWNGIASWYGVETKDMGTILPVLKKFPSDTHLRKSELFEVEEDPTAAPAAAPTTAPTAAPTAVPTTPAATPPSDTNAPTDVPTDAPTDVPTDAPTDAPTAPTNAPTYAPTKAPTRAPTHHPTHNVLPELAVFDPADFPDFASVLADQIETTEAPTTAPTSKPTTRGKKWRRKAKRLQARAVRIQLKLQRLQLQGKTGRRFKRILERGLSRGIGCMEGDEEVYCFVIISKVGGETISQETSTHRRRLIGLQEVEFSVVDPSGENGAMIDKNIGAATTNDGGENALLSNLQQEAFNEGLLTEDLALMTSSEMGAPTMEQTTVTTYEDEEYNYNVESADSSTSTGESSNDTSSSSSGLPIAAISGGLLLVIVLAAIVLRRRDSKHRERSSRSPSDALDELGSQKQRMQRGDGSFKSDRSASKSHFDTDPHNHTQENEASGRSNSVEAAVDPTTGKTYYHNVVTDKTAWTPEEASRGHGQSMGQINDGYEHAAASMARTTSVRAAVDSSSGQTYYHNTVTNETAWTANAASRKYSHVAENVGVRVTEIEEEVFHNPMFAKKPVRGFEKTLEPKKSQSSVF